MSISFQKPDLGSSNFFFEHDPVVIDELDVVEENGRRLYVTPSGQKYPSITTVLSILNKKSIQQWRERVGEEEANKISSRASSRGTRIHKMCEDYLNNVLQESIEKYSYSDRFMFDSMRTVFDEHIGKVRVQEASLYSDFMRVAGRVDCMPSLVASCQSSTLRLPQSQKKRDTSRVTLCRLPATP